MTLPAATVDDMAKTMSTTTTATDTASIVDANIDNDKKTKKISMLPGSPELLKFFWNLSSQSDDERVMAAERLVLYLQKATHDEIMYSVKRLVRGLASSQGGSRQGFVVALTEVLTEFPATSVSTKYILQLVEANMMPSGGTKGQEEKDIYFGQIFAIAALIRAGRFSPCQPVLVGKSNKKKKLHSVKESEHDEVAEGAMESLQILLDLSQKKSYLRTLCAETTIELLRQVGVDGVRELSSLMQPLFARMPATPDVLALAIEVEPSLPPDERSILGIYAPTSAKPILHVSNLRVISDVMRQATDAAAARVHPVWTCALAHVGAPLESLNVEVPISGDFGAFWTQVVDENLFASSSPQHRELGLRLLGGIMPRLASAKVSQAFATRATRCLLAELAKRENMLHAAATHTLALLVRAASDRQNSSDPIAVAIAAHLLSAGQNGSRVDRKVNTIAVDELLALLDSDGMAEYVISLQKMFLTPGIENSNGELYGYGGFGDGDDDDEWKGSGAESAAQRRLLQRRTFLLNQLGSLAKSGRERLGDEAVLNIVKFLGFIAFFSSNISENVVGNLPSAEPAIDESVRKICEQRFFALVSDMVSWPTMRGNNNLEDSKHSHLSLGLMTDNELWVRRICEYLDSCLSSSETITRNTEAFSKDAHKSWSQLLSTAAKVRNEGCESTLKTRDRALQLLCFHIALEVLADAPAVMHAATDVRFCVLHFLGGMTNGKKKTPSKKKKNKATTAADDDNEIMNNADMEPVEVLTDVMLSLLSMPSNRLRTIAQHVFREIAPLMTPISLGLLAQVIASDDSVDEMENIFENQDSEEDEEYNDDDNDENIGEYDANNENTNDDAMSVDSDTNNDDVSDDSDDADDEGEVDEELKRKVKDALGEAALPVHGVDENDDDGSGSEMSDLDDDQMMQFDDALANIFREQAKIKGAGKKKDEKLRKVVQFKLRVLDLIDIYIRRTANNALVLELIEPLFRGLMLNAASAVSSPLSQRVASLLTNRLAKSKEIPSSDVDAVRVNEILVALLDIAHKTNVPLVASTSSECISYLCRVLMAIDTVTTESQTPSKKKSSKKSKGTTPKVSTSSFGSLDIETLEAVYGTFFSQFLNGKSRLQLPFFKAIVTRHPVIGWHLAKTWAEALTRNSASGSGYLLNSAFELMDCILSTRGTFVRIVGSETATTRFAELLNEIGGVVATVLTRLREGSIKVKHIKNIIRFALVSTQTALKTNNDNRNPLGRNILGVVDDLVSSNTLDASPGVRSKCNQLLLLLRGESAAKNKAAGKGVAVANIANAETDKPTKSSTKKRSASESKSSPSGKKKKLSGKHSAA